MRPVNMTRRNSVDLKVTDSPARDFIREFDRSLEQLLNLALRGRHDQVTDIGRASWIRLRDSHR